MRTFARCSCLSRPRFRSKVQQGKKIGGPKTRLFLNVCEKYKSGKHMKTPPLIDILYIICSDASSAHCASDVRRAWYWPGCWPDRTKIDLIHLGPWVGSTNHLNNPLSISTSWTWTHGHQSISSLKHGMISISSSNSESTTCATFFIFQPVFVPAFSITLHLSDQLLQWGFPRSQSACRGWATSLPPVSSGSYWHLHLENPPARNTEISCIPWIFFNDLGKGLYKWTFPEKILRFVIFCLNQLLLCRANGLTSMEISGPMPLSWS